MAAEMYIKPVASFSVFSVSGMHIHHHHGRIEYTERMPISFLSRRDYLENIGQKAK